MMMARLGCTDSFFLPFFSCEVGKTSYNVHPFLYLQGASTKILANILNYIYLGIVQCNAEDAVVPGHLKVKAFF